MDHRRGLRGALRLLLELLGTLSPCRRKERIWVCAGVDDMWPGHCRAASGLLKCIPLLGGRAVRFGMLVRRRASILVA